VYANGATYLKVEAELVDGDGVLAGIVLHDASEEGLCEVEPRHPEHVGLAVVIPFLSTCKVHRRLMTGQYVNFNVKLSCAVGQ